jgi:CRISPR/Cas system CSM-associated protein Csm2 small subunit
MTAASLVQEVLAQIQDAVAREACAFFQRHHRLADLKASQMNALKAVWEKPRDWTSLKDDLEAFLKHQQQRDERVGVTGWQKIAADLQKTLTGLAEAVQEDVISQLESTADTLLPIASPVAEQVRYYFGEPQKDERKRRLEAAKYQLARNFLACLYRLYRGQEVLKTTLSQGQLYSQGDCHA